MNKKQSNVRRSTPVPIYDIKTTTPVGLRDVPKHCQCVLVATYRAEATREVRPSILEWKRRFEANLARIRRDKALSSGLTNI